MTSMGAIMKRIVCLNQIGLRLGEDHQNAKLTNAEVDLLLTLRDEGLSYRQLALKFEISKSSVRDICKGRRRCQSPTRWKTILISD
jgi:DNA-binding CsgD family transcriptional regulator